MCRRLEPLDWALEPFYLAEEKAAAHSSSVGVYTCAGVESLGGFRMIQGSGGFKRVQEGSDSNPSNRHSGLNHRIWVEFGLDRRLWVEFGLDRRIWVARALVLKATEFLTTPRLVGFKC